MVLEGYRVVVARSPGRTPLPAGVAELRPGPRRWQAGQQAEQGEHRLRDFRPLHHRRAAAGDSRQGSQVDSHARWHRAEPGDVRVVHGPGRAVKRH